MTARAEARPWLFGPGIDLAVGAGGLALPLVLLSPPLLRGLGHDAALVFPALALVCNYPHYFATLHRAYRTRTECARYRLYTVYLTTMLLAATAATLAMPGLLPLIFTAYLTWSPWHYSGQSYGIALLFLRRLEASPTRLEARLLKAAFISSSLIAMAFLHRAGSSSPAQLSLEMPRAVTTPLVAGLLAVHAACAGAALVRLARRHGLKPLVPALSLLVAQGVWFTGLGISMLAPGVHWAPHRLGLGEVALLHCAQYLWIMAWYARRQSNSVPGIDAAGQPKALTTVRRESKGKFWLEYGLLLVAGGMALWLPGPWLVSRLGGFDFQQCFLTFTAFINLHHFLLDGAVWRMRDPRVARALGVEGPGARSLPRAVQATFPAGSPGEDREATPTEVGHGHGHGHVLRYGHGQGLRYGQGLAVVGAGAGLLGVAGIDLAFRYHQVHQAEPAHLERALQLNPFDSGLQTTRAVQAAAHGQLEAAIAGHRRALELNPRNPTAWYNLALCLEPSDPAGALEALEQAVAVDPRHYAALLKLGALQTAGQDPARGLTALEAAARLRPLEPAPWMQLARALERLERTAEAEAAFTRAMALSARSGGGAAVGTTERAR